jgi:uncharacterized protein DUF4038/collagenase-like protein with putative collagen-binding domain
MLPLALLLFLLPLLSGSSCGGSSGGGGGGGSGGGSGTPSGMTPVQSASFPLHVSADERNLEDGRGRDFRINGDAAWSLMVQLDKADAQAYLEDRRQRGFNTVLVNLIERGHGGPENAEGQAPFLRDSDFTMPNSAYFDHAAWVLDRAAERGILVLLAPAYLGVGCGSEGWCDQMLSQSVDAMRSYGRFLGNRFRGYTNIIWVNGGDTNASSHHAESYVDAIALGIREISPGQLQTAHCSRNNSAIECYPEPWLDVNTTYSDCSRTLGATQDDWQRVPPRVFFYIEGRYENEGADIGCLIDQHAWSVLGGSSGHVFGNGPIWPFEPGWQRDLDSPGTEAMRNLSRLFQSRSAPAFVPDYAGAVLTNGGSGAIAARTTDSSSLLVYVPSARDITVDLRALSGPLARAWWFNPAEGDSQDLGQIPARGVMVFHSPGRRVLVVDDASRAKGVPGA